MKILSTNAVGNTNHDISGVVVEHGGYVLPRKGIGGVGDEETCFSWRTIANTLFYILGV